VSGFSRFGKHGFLSRSLSEDLSLGDSSDDVIGVAFNANRDFLSRKLSKLRIDSVYDNITDIHVGNTGGDSSKDFVPRFMSGTTEKQVNGPAVSCADPSTRELDMILEDLFRDIQTLDVKHGASSAKRIEEKGCPPKVFTFDRLSTEEIECGRVKTSDISPDVCSHKRRDTRGAVQPPDICADTRAHARTSDAAKVQFNCSEDSRRCAESSEGQSTPSDNESKESPTGGGREVRDDWSYTYDDDRETDSLQDTEVNQGGEEDAHIRRDSGVGSSLTRPNGFELLCFLSCLRLQSIL